MSQSPNFQRCSEEDLLSGLRAESTQEAGSNLIPPRLKTGNRQGRKERQDEIRGQPKEHIRIRLMVGLINVTSNLGLLGGSKFTVL